MILLLRGWWNFLHSYRVLCLRIYSRRRMFIAYCVGIKRVFGLLQELTHLFISYKTSIVIWSYISYGFISKRTSLITGIFDSRLILPSRKLPITVKTAGFNLYTSALWISIVFPREAGHDRWCGIALFFSYISSHYAFNLRLIAATSWAPPPIAHAVKTTRNNNCA